MWREIGFTLVVYLVLLNGFMRGRKKLEIDAFLSLVWISLIAWSIVAAGWRGGGRAFAGSFVIGIPLLMLARLTAALIWGRFHERTPAITLGILVSGIVVAGLLTLLYPVLGISWFFR
jgi:hypothetical protein